MCKITNSAQPYSIQFLLSLCLPGIHAGCLKDLDLDVCLQLGNATGSRTLRVLSDDAAFLKRCGVMDYSLLLGIHEEAAPSSPGTTENCESGTACCGRLAGEGQIECKRGCLCLFGQTDVRRRPDKGTCDNLNEEASDDLELRSDSDGFTPGQGSWGLRGEGQNVAAAPAMQGEDIEERLARSIRDLDLDEDDGIIAIKGRLVGD